MRRGRQRTPRPLANVRFLACYRRGAFIAASLIPAVLAAAAGVLSGGAIERELSRGHPPMLVRPVVLHLLWTGGLQADPDTPVVDDTPVRLRDEAG